MEEHSGTSKRSPEKEEVRFVLDEIVKEVAMRMLQAAIENEVCE